MLSHSIPTKDVMREPIVRAFSQALQAVLDTGDPIDASMAMALTNNANSKLHQSLSPALTDATGAGPSYFSEQAAAYRKLTTLAQSKDLFNGIAGAPQHSRG